MTNSATHYLACMMCPSDCMEREVCAKGCIIERRGRGAIESPQRDKTSV